MGGSALHKASTYKGQHNVEGINVSTASMVFENASSVFQRLKSYSKGPRKS